MAPIYPIEELVSAYRNYVDKFFVSNSNEGLGELPIYRPEIFTPMALTDQLVQRKMKHFELSTKVPESYHSLQPEPINQELKQEQDLNHSLELELFCKELKQEPDPFQEEEQELKQEEEQEKGVKRGLLQELDFWSLQLSIT